MAQLPSTTIPNSPCLPDPTVLSDFTSTSNISSTLNASDSLTAFPQLHSSSPVSKERTSAFPKVEVSIDTDLVSKYGGLKYAELRKTQAREEFKQRKKFELITSGSSHAARLRPHNGLSEKQKYDRRLTKNRDSAAAARYAHAVFVAVLERLVVLSEEQMLGFGKLMKKIRSQNDELADRLDKLQAMLDEMESVTDDDLVGNNDNQLNPFSHNTSLPSGFDHCLEPRLVPSEIL